MAPSATPHAAAASKLRTVLRRQFGLEDFRPGQEEVIRALLARRDVLAVLPTGAGKSLVYQLAAQLLPGATIVVSPLLALMKDQLDSLEDRGVAAGGVSSAIPAADSQQSLEDIRSDTSKLLYVTPERFENDAFMKEARRLDVSLLVIDEAHCISEWGHSFRPSYLTLESAAQALGRPTILALTATATPWVRRDISNRLGLRDPLVVVRGSDRPNLFLEVRRVEDEHDDRRQLESLLVETHDFGTAPYAAHESLATRLRDAMRGSGIIYCATTAAARETARWLRQWGIAADYYHGQRRKADRLRVQDAFMAGDLRVIAATNAFGLGVDKPDVRFVVHRDVPASLEAYYQEAGRAGRDGDLARCLLIYRPGDLGRAAFLAAPGRLTREEVERALAPLLALRAGTRRQMEDASGLSRGDFTRLVFALVGAGLMRETTRRFTFLREDITPDDVPLDAEDRRAAYERSRQQMVSGYADDDGCRRRTLLAYFGEEYDVPHCGSCDNDFLRQSAPKRRRQSRRRAPSGRVAVGDRLTHRTFGPGTVTRVEDDALTVLFENEGYKKLSLQALDDPTLLERAA